MGESGSIDLCGDVTDPMSISEIMGLMGSLNNLGDQPAGSLNMNRIVCGMLAIPTKSPSEVFDETCPGLAGVVGNPPNIQLLNTSFGCNENVLKLAGTPMDVNAIYDNLGTAILSFFPQGYNYASARKFIDYDKWWCIAFLALIFAAFFVFYWITSKVSIRL